MLNSDVRHYFKPFRCYMHGDHLSSLPVHDPPPVLPTQQQQMRANISGASFPSELRDLLQRRLGELEKQLLKKVSSLEEEKSVLSNATAAYRLKTESTLNALVERINELEKGKQRTLRRPTLAVAQVTSALG